ncbi:hypothetical protein RZS08_52935, partial [Arthrospira platensis SPKY1]|nr:hypothetical protein [Arthrospira platensis SPKY1]
ARAVRDEAAAASGPGQGQSPVPSGPIHHARQVLTQTLTQALTQALGDALGAPLNPSPAQGAAAERVTAGAECAARPARPTLVTESQIDDAIETALLLQLIE